MITEYMAWVKSLKVLAKVLVIDYKNRVVTLDVDNQQADSNNSYYWHESDFSFDEVIFVLHKQSMGGYITQREEILTEANNIVNGARNEAYGSPEDNFKRIADYWSSYLDKEITAHDVAMMMILLKVTRTQSGTGSMDNYVDIAGYAACAGEIYKSMED